MQLRAHDLHNQLVNAHQAQKHQDYLCIECGQTIRLRSGIHRQPHFFHIKPNGACRLNGKSITHLIIQNHLKNLLPEGEVQLEHRFPDINRIADVAWIKEKLIFEIQCSPITADEIKMRNENYSSIGYQVVWIMHDARYNQKKLSAAEDYLRKRLQPHYYTNMDESGCGHIYDQPFLHSKGLKTHQLPPLSINPADPQRKKTKCCERTPRQICERARCYTVHFTGDYISRSSASNLDPEQLLALDQFADEERKLQLAKGFSHLTMDQILSMRISQAISIAWRWWIVRPYLAVLRLLLERACN